MILFNKIKAWLVRSELYAYKENLALSKVIMPVNTTYSTFIQMELPLKGKVQATVDIDKLYQL